MAVGAILISLPFALTAALWLKLLHGWSLVGAATAYAGFGTLAFVTVATALILATRDDPRYGL